MEVIIAFQIDKNGNISIIQGDSGLITIRGLNPNKNFTVYFAIQDQNRNPIGEELSVESNNNDYVVFRLTGSYTDLLRVRKDEPFAIYYYGLKICEENNQREDTLRIGSDEIGNLNTITVYPKKVEGD